MFVQVIDAFDRVVREPASPLIPGARIEPLMSNREDHDLLGEHPVRNRVREAPQHVPLRSPADGPPLRRAQDQIHGLLNVGRKPDAQTLSRLLVPENPVAEIVARRA